MFYVLSALWMPFRELALTVWGRSSLRRWAAVGTHVGVAASVVMAVWSIGWVLGPALLRPPAPSAPGPPGARAVAEGGETQVAGLIRENLLGIEPVVVALAMLGMILGSVQVVRLLASRRPGGRRPGPVPGRPPAPPPAH